MTRALETEPVDACYIGDRATADALLARSVNVVLHRRQWYHAADSSSREWERSYRHKTARERPRVDCVHTFGHSAMLWAVILGRREDLEIDHLEQNGLHTTAQLVRNHMNSPKHFLSAVQRGNFDLVRRLVNAKVASLRGEHRSTPLHDAVCGRVCVSTRFP